MRVGIDLEQFARDPYGSGIQRVLQYLAHEWPSEKIEADFIFPDRGLYALLTPAQAFEILSIPFAVQPHDSDLRELVREGIAQMSAPRVREADLLSFYTSWLLPEVSYSPEVLNRFRIFNASMITVMIGFDALPMTEPRNYRFPPGMAPYVSDYFRQLAVADRVICISDHARDEMWSALRRPMNLTTEVAHPGGDHINFESAVNNQSQPKSPVKKFIRLGTLEARKMPVEILNAFLEARPTQAELVFIGGASSSDESINSLVRAAVDNNESVTWIQGASDEEVREAIASADAFLAIGTEGFGIPVLEAIALGTPVLYSGVQPAAEIMLSKGATQLPGHSHGELVEMFTNYSRPDVLSELAREIDLSRLPQWKQFVGVVARLCRS